MSISLNVFTLNCWGIPVVSKDKTDRFAAIADYLSKGEHNIVCLQEVWSETDFLWFRALLLDVLPYSHYFYSGVVGSGLCIFSKYVIEDIFYFQWPLNGYIHKIHHGDWFGGKGVGFCKIRCQGKTVNVYCTHLHAEYHEDDMYLPHRVLQAYTTAEFVKLTEEPADLVLLAGDFNTEPGTLAYRLLAALPGLEDPRKSHRLAMGTSECSRNSYSNPEAVLSNPNGVAIDHIFYKTGANLKASVTKFGFPLPERVKDQKFSYSDHEALTLELTITPRDSKETVTPSNEIRAILLEARDILQQAESVVINNRRNYFIYAFCVLTALLSIVGVFDGAVLMLLLRVVLCFLLFYFVIMALLWSRIELNALKGASTAIYNSLNFYNMN